MMPDKAKIKTTQPDSDGPLFSTFVSERRQQWWERKHDGIHSINECKNTLLHHTDSDELWHCCPFWQRKLSNKLNAREFAIKCGVPVPKLYWSGKNPAEIPFGDLPADYVVKTSTGWSSNGVLPLKAGRNVRNDKLWSREMVIEKYSKMMSREPFSKGYVFVEELIHAAAGEKLRDCKIQVFDGRAGLISIIDRSTQSAVRFTRDGQEVREQIHKLHSPAASEELPSAFSEIVTCGETLGRAYGHTFVRIDLYSTPAGVLFGEFTPTPAIGKGFTEFGDRMLGAMCAEMQRAGLQTDE